MINVCTALYVAITARFTKLKKCIFNSCNMGTSVLPDMYTRITRAAGPRDEGVHIRQNTSAHVTTIM